MCQFCMQHGEGKKWYLQAKNYSDDLMSDLRRQKFAIEFFEHPEALPKADAALARLAEAPGFVRQMVTANLVGRQKKQHYGQVVPIEDVEQILEFVNSLTRVACICRYAKFGKEHRYCYGISMGPGGGLAGIIDKVHADYLNGPHSAGLETLHKEEALAAFRQHEREGLVHSVWTFMTPYIGGICNCDRADCMAMRATLGHGFPVMFRAEYVGQVRTDLCNGCRACMRSCQFGAMGYSAATKRVAIDAKRCFGCGICRAACKESAITLHSRASVPAAARLW